MRWAALALLALALTGCETTAEKSARLERAAKGQEAAAKSREAAAQRALALGPPSRRVSVVAATLIHTPTATAAVLELRNSSSQAVGDVPVAITVRDARGGILYSNRTTGQTPALLSAALLPPHSETVWIDDQVQAQGVPQSVRGEVGEGRTVSGAIPSLSVEGVKQSEESETEHAAEGSVVNHSADAESEVVVDAYVRRSGRIVAAGRAVVPQLPASTSTRFQLFFVGDPRGGQLHVSVLPAVPGSG